MPRNIQRREFLAGTAAGAAAIAVPDIAQNAPMKIGLLTVKTGPLAAGGLHAEEGITSFLKDKNFTLGGRKVTLKQAVAASGGMDNLAVPRRCELIRRIGPNQEVWVQVDLQRIFDGEQPDIFLKPNDLVNVGTDAIMPFLAVMRNAYRVSYGWGFVYDKNLSPDSGSNNNNR